MSTFSRFAAAALTSLVLVCTAVIAPAHAAGTMVSFQTAARPGTILVSTGERQLFLVLGGGRALRYSVGVGRSGRQWTGETAIEALFLEPDWVPPSAIRRDRPNLPKVIPGGSAANPMGAAALTLSGGVYAIHGTNSPESIGGFVSYGCIRMHNADVLDLLRRVRVGTQVRVY